MNFQIFAQNQAVQSINGFGLAMYKQLPKDTNLFISPFSTNAALTMVFAGASGKTELNMSWIMKISNNSEHINSFKEVQKSILNANNNNIIKVANSLWYQKDYNFEKNYIKFITDSFDAFVEKTDFVELESREKARRNINAWVEKNTENKIKDLLDPTVLTPQTRMVLTNAIYFNAAWEHSFDENKTRQDIFYLNKSENATIDFMHKNSDLAYMETDSFQAVAIPYKENALSFLIFLPKDIEGLQELENKLNDNFVQQFFAQHFLEATSLTIPKFKMEYSVELSKTLINMGMDNPFSGEADFSKINVDKEIKLDKVIHKTFISIDEKGTEAAAATAAVTVRKTSIGNLKEKTFKANHPFLFVIVDNKTKAILFMGRYAQPEN
jgi:serpin B